MLISMIHTTRQVPFRGHETWVQITSPDDPRPGTLPLFVLHGGPGMAHNYVRNIAELADETGRTVVHYDQIGCGNSTHLPDAPTDFWTPTLVRRGVPRRPRSACASTSTTCSVNPGAAC